MAPSPRSSAARTLAVALAGVAALLTGCGRGADPTGVWVADAELLAPAPGAPAHASGPATQGEEPWSLTLELRADHTFTLAMQLPRTARPVAWSGTWRDDSPELELTTTHENGAPLAAPRTQIATLRGDRLEFRPAAAGPRFWLRRW